MSGGNFGTLSVPKPLLPDAAELSAMDLTTLGLSFGSVAKPKATGIKTAQVLPGPEPQVIVLQDERTREDIQRESKALIVNALDLPDSVVQEARVLTQSKMTELRDYVMINIVPLLLCVDPALNSVKQMIPNMFDDKSEDGLDIELSVGGMLNYAGALALTATRLKLIDMLDFSPEVRARLVARLIPEQNPASNLPMHPRS